MNFKDLNLSKSICKAIESENYSEPTAVQEETIPHILERKDVIVSSQTGTGKTAAFALPILELLLDRQDLPKRDRVIRALIISPTRELAEQLLESFKTYGKYTNLRMMAVYGGIPMDPQIEQLRSGMDILIATPGRLVDLHYHNKVYLDFVDILVLDEADLMLDMGFAEDMQKISLLCPEEKQVLLFSATIPRKVSGLAKKLLFEPVLVESTQKSSTAKGVSQLLYYVPKPRKVNLCLHLVRNVAKGQIIIFRRTKFGVDKLEKILLKNKYKVETIHGDKSQTARQNALDAFKNKEVRILIATDVASRGLDIEGVDAVINFDMPNIPETYVHRIGRTGRAGSTGQSYSMVSPDEERYIVAIQKLIQKVIPVDDKHPFVFVPDKNKPKRKDAPLGVINRKPKSKHKKGRKSAASKKNKKRWY